METENQTLSAHYLYELLATDLSGQQFDLDLGAIVAVADSNGIIKFVNDNFVEKSGFPRDELLGKNFGILNSNYHPSVFFNNLWDTIKNGKIWKGEIRNKNKNGTIYWEDMTIIPFMDKYKKPIKYISISHDITSLKESKITHIISSKLSALNELAANLTHEINNPLGVILGRCEMLINHINSESIDPTQMNLLRKIFQ
jgi:PAS domain S-box-containing protein